MLSVQGVLDCYWIKTELQVGPSVPGIKRRSEFSEGLSVRGERKNMKRILVCHIFCSEVLLVMGLRDVKPGVLGT